MPVRRVTARQHPVRVAAFLIGALAAPACGGGTEPEAAPATLAVTVQPARLGDLREALAVTGLVVPALSGDFTVIALEPAEIVELPKAEGEAVQAGDLLVRFDIASITSDLAARQLEVGAATLRLESARAEADKLGALFERGLAARNAWEAAKAALAQAESALNLAKSQLDSARALQERTVVRARFAGTVVKVWHMVGDLVAGGTSDPILRVIDPAQTQVTAQVPLTAVDRLAAGQPATVLTASGTTHEATVVSRSAVTDTAATTVELRLAVNGPALPIDSVVQVELVLAERHGVLVVPTSAIQRAGGQPYVWLAGDDGLAHQREIRVGLTASGQAEALTGLVAGDRVIVTGIAELNEGTPITVTSR